MITINVHSSIKISDKKIYYFDPFKIENKIGDADYIFITHNHYDHYDIESILNIMNEKTIFIVPEYLKEDIQKISNNIISVLPNNKYNIENLNFETMPSYNINKNFHPKSQNNVGYLINIDSISYYIPGDTDVINEMLNIKTDICFIPIGGYYTMDYREAANYINKIKPKKCIPIHYGSIVGDVSLGNQFKNLIDKNIEVELMIK